MKDDIPYPSDPQGQFVDRTPRELKEAAKKAAQESMQRFYIKNETKKTL